jgi:hypothetical protein
MRPRRGTPFGSQGSDFALGARLDEAAGRLASRSRLTRQSLRRSPGLFQADGQDRQRSRHLHRNARWRLKDRQKPNGLSAELLE